MRKRYKRAEATSLELVPEGGMMSTSMIDPVTVTVDDYGSVLFDGPDGDDNTDYIDLTF